MHKKEYSRPELSLMKFTLKDVILTSPEYNSSHLDGGDLITDPIIDSDPDDDDILW